MMNLNKNVLIPFVFLLSITLLTQGSPNNVLQIICLEPWFSYIKSGIKSVEGRKNTPKYQSLKVGDLLDFHNGNTDKPESFRALITEIRRYSSLEEYLTDIGVEKAVPGTPSLQAAIEIYHQWSTPEEIKQHGFVGIFIEPVNE